MIVAQPTVDRHLAWADRCRSQSAGWGNDVTDTEHHRPTHVLDGTDNRASPCRAPHANGHFRCGSDPVGPGRPPSGISHRHANSIPFEPGEVMLPAAAGVGEPLSDSFDIADVAAMVLARAGHGGADDELTVAS